MDTKITILLTYLKAASAETRHAVMRNYPKELPMAEVVAYLKDDPATEKATALLMYWAMYPRFSKQFEAEEARAKEQERFGEVYFDLIEDLERKYVAGFYTAQTIGYDPYYDYSRESGYFGEKRRLPSVMTMPVYGKTIDTVAYDRDHNLQNGLTATVLTALRSTVAPAVETEAAPVIPEATPSPFAPFQPLLAGEKPATEESAEQPVMLENLKRTEAPEWAEEVEEAEQWEEEEAEDPYVLIPDTQRKPNNSTGGCGAFIAIAAIIMVLMRMCQN